MLELLLQRRQVLLLRAAAAAVFGVGALVWPGTSVRGLAPLFGAYAVTDGVLAVGTALGGSGGRDRMVLGFEGLVDVIAGGVVLVWPSITGFSLAMALAAWAVARGIAMVSAGRRLRTAGADDSFLLLAGVASLSVGLVLGLRPRVDVVAVAWLTGAYALAFGGLLAGVARRLRAGEEQSSDTDARGEAVRTTEPAE